MIFKRLTPLAVAFCVLLLLAGCRATYPPLPCVSQVDLRQYAGRWYEIASFPQRAQRGCNCTTATYTLTEKGYVEVYNRCQDGKTGKVKSIRGKAFPESGSQNTRLKVQFFPLFKAPYYIIDLDSSYSYAAVGTPSRQYLWILSREPQMADSLYQDICARVKALGFEPKNLVKTNQSCSSY